MEWRRSAQRVTRAWNAWLAAESRDRGVRYREFVAALADEERAATKVERMIDLAEAGHCVTTIDAQKRGLGDEVLEWLSDELSEHTFPETHAAVTQLATGIHPDVHGVVAELASLRNRLAHELGAMGLSVADAGTHPLTVREETEVSGAVRYRALDDTLRVLARREPTMALHVHVGAPSPGHISYLVVLHAYPGGDPQRRAADQLPPVPSRPLAVHAQRPHQRVRHDQARPDTRRRPVALPGDPRTGRTEVLFFLALTFGLREDPPAAVAQAIGLIEAVAERHGVPHPFQGTIATTDGQSIWASRYSSERKSRTLFYTTDVPTLRELQPDRQTAERILRRRAADRLRTARRHRRSLERSTRIQLLHRQTRRR